MRKKVHKNYNPCVHALINTVENACRDTLATKYKMNLKKSNVLSKVAIRLLINKVRSTYLFLNI